MSHYNSADDYWSWISLSSEFVKVSTVFSTILWYLTFSSVFESSASAWFRCVPLVTHSNTTDWSSLHHIYWPWLPWRQRQCYQDKECVQTVDQCWQVRLQHFSHRSRQAGTDMLPQTDTFYKETNNFSFSFNAEFTTRTQWVRICLGYCVRIFIKVYAPQQLLKLADLLKESGEVVVNSRPHVSHLMLNILYKKDTMIQNLSETEFHNTMKFVSTQQLLKITAFVNGVWWWCATGLSVGSAETCVHVKSFKTS